MSDLIEPYPGAATDLRRSLAMMAHYINSDLDGIAAIAREASEDQREDAEFKLLLAVLDIGYSYSPQMHHPRATEFLSRIAAQCVVHEEQQ